MYELFRRAIVDRDAEAWASVHGQFRRMLIAWAGCFPSARIRATVLPEPQLNQLRYRIPASTQTVPRTRMRSSVMNNASVVLLS